MAKAVRFPVLRYSSTPSLHWLRIRHNIRLLAGADGGDVVRADLSSGAYAGNDDMLILGRQSQAGRPTAAINPNSCISCTVLAIVTIIHIEVARYIIDNSHIAKYADQQTGVVQAESAGDLGRVVVQ